MVKLSSLSHKKREDKYKEEIRMAEEKFGEEEYRRKNAELMDRIQTLESIAKLGGFSESQELSLSEARGELARLEASNKKELDRIVDDAVESGEFERVPGGIREKQ